MWELALPTGRGAPWRPDATALAQRPEAEQYMTAGVRCTYVSSPIWQSMKSATSAREILGMTDPARISMPWR